MIVAPEQPQALVEALAAPETAIVTLTITEKGYAARRERRPSSSPRASACAARAGSRPSPRSAATISPHNGRALRDAVLAASEGALRDWIAEQGAFPQTMVDRIVPATDEADIDALAGRIGLVDRAMVKAEPFSQWVIEDRFAGPRPDFAAAGVRITADVAPWEEAKLRLLNGAHSAIAYLGGLAGIEFVYQFVALPAGRRFVEALWDELAPTLSPPPELDLAAYRAALLARFSNAALGHRTRQIAMDGSQKLPQRLLAPIAERLARGEQIEALALGGRGLDALAERAHRCGRGVRSGRPARRRDRALRRPARRPGGGGFGVAPGLPARARRAAGSRDALTRQLTRLSEMGAQAAVESFTSG